VAIRAYPKLAPNPGTLRVWVGTRQNARLPQLTFTVNGLDRAPKVLRPMNSIRSPELLNDAGTPRAFSGVFEFDGLAEGQEHEIRVRADTEMGLAVARARTLPRALSADPESWFNVLVGSCFYPGGDNAKFLKTTLANLPVAFRPNASLLLGDQVYLDLPTFEDFENDLKWLAARFERTYAETWFGEDYSPILSLAPSACVPDDHEYWNNYPHHSPFVGNTATERGRKRWETAARALFTGFQLGSSDAIGTPVVFDVAPLSFFLADTRTFRSADRARTMHPDALLALGRWVQYVRDHGLTGVFVSGQSLFDEAANALESAVADRSLANYGDYRRILTHLAELSSAGRTLLCVTGDVHWGRVLRASDPLSGAPRAFEVICSPSSLVDSPWDFWNRIRHAGADWPRHSDGLDGPRSFPIAGQRWSCKPVYKRKGDQVAVLSFRRFAGSVQLRVSYWPVHGRADVRRPKILEPFALSTPG